MPDGESSVVLFAVEERKSHIHNIIILYLKKNHFVLYLFCDETDRK